MPTHNALPIEHYQALAEDYVKITKAEGFRGVTEKIAVKHGISPITAGSRIRRARVLGLLEPYSSRLCGKCGQSVLRAGTEIPTLETFAKDQADVCSRLATFAQSENRFKMSGALLAAATDFRAAARALIVAHDLALQEGAILPVR